MLFILEKEDQTSFEKDIELLIVQKALNENKFLHEYTFHKINDFYHILEVDKFKLRTNLLSKDQFPEKYHNAIPIGGIPFVESYLKIFHNIEMEYPIEIPPILRTDEFLKRKYSIVPAEEIPKSGQYFIKDASQLKVFSYNGELSMFLTEDIFTPNEYGFDPELRLNPNHLYQVSEIVNILSEYRVYVIRDKIEAIEFYNGNPCVFPDVNLINKASLLYSTQKDCPHSYSIDIMVTDRGSAITEIHNFTSLGLYTTLWGSNLLQGYIDGINYLINYNTPPTPFSNFNTFGK